jgi:hypothetical protein
MASFENLPAMIVNGSAASPLSTSSWAGIVLAIWIFGLFVVALRLIAGLARLAWMSRQATTQLDESWLHCVKELCDSFTPSASVAMLQSSSYAAHLGIFEAGGCRREALKNGQ